MRLQDVRCIGADCEHESVLRHGGYGHVDMELAGVMVETEFIYDSKLDVRLPMVGTVAMKGRKTGKYVGSCPAS